MRAKHRPASPSGGVPTSLGDSGGLDWDHVARMAKPKKVITELIVPGAIEDWSRRTTNPTFPPMWRFPKIGDPNIAPPNNRILIIRTPIQGWETSMCSLLGCWVASIGMSNVAPALKPNPKILNTQSLTLNKVP